MILKKIIELKFSQIFKFLKPIVEESDFKTYTFFWVNGKKDIIKGINPKEAFLRSGYFIFTDGPLIDFYIEGSDNEDEVNWNLKNNIWITNKKTYEFKLNGGN